MHADTSAYTLIHTSHTLLSQSGLTLTFSSNVNKCFLESHNVVYCSSQLIVVTVVDSVFWSKSGQNGSLGQKIASAAHGGAKTKASVFQCRTFSPRLWFIIIHMSFLPIIMYGNSMETEFELRWGLLLVFLLENVYQIREFKWSGTSGRLIVQDLFLLF